MRSRPGAARTILLIPLVLGPLNSLKLWSTYPPQRYSMFDSGKKNKQHNHRHRVYEPGHCEAPRQHSKGQECEVHRGALAHAHKRTGRSPHRLPCCGNPGILLAMLLEQSPVLPATMAGTRSVLPSDHGWFENDLRLTWHGPYNRFVVTVYVMSRMSRYLSI